MIHLSYNTNGLRNLSLSDAIKAVKRFGYSGIELSLHANHLHPLKVTHAERQAIKSELNKSGLACACLATGCDNILSEIRFEPSLINHSGNGRKERINLLKESMDLAEELGFKIVNFASGFQDKSVDAETSVKYLQEGITELLNHNQNIILAIEPEPDMFIGTTTSAIKIIELISNKRFKLNLDIGHVYCCEDDYLTKIDHSIPYTVHTHIEDIKNRVHYHEIPGEGDIDFAKVLDLFYKHDYKGYLSVELYNHADVYETALEKSKLRLEQEMLNFKS